MTRIALIALLLTAGVVCANDPPGHASLAPPKLTLPSDTGKSIGYHVGGGALPHFGDARGPNDGTWGWDYRGILPRRVNNGWLNGRRYQGGTGAYKTDGPHFYLHDQKQAR